MGHLGHPIYVCIYLDIVTWCGLQCYFIDHHFIVIRRVVGSFSYRSTYGVFEKSADSRVT